MKYHIVENSTFTKKDGTKQPMTSYYMAIMYIGKTPFAVSMTLNKKEAKIFNTRREAEKITLKLNWKPPRYTIRPTEEDYTVIL